MFVERFFTRKQQTTFARELALLEGKTVMSTIPPTQQSVAERPLHNSSLSFFMQSRLLVSGLALLAAAILVLFPFDWLGEVWLGYAQIFDVVFATALSHMIGHATIFFIASLLVLFSFPVLRYRPVLYFAIMLLGAVGEEALQSLFKLQLPTIWDGRDLLLDSAGIIVGYVIVRLWLLIVTKSR